jgi:hypothetical protein
MLTGPIGLYPEGVIKEYSPPTSASGNPAILPANPRPLANPWPLAGPWSFTKQIVGITVGENWTINAFGGTAPLNSVVDVATGTFMLPSIDALGTAVVAGAV